MANIDFYMTLQAMRCLNPNDARIGIDPADLAEDTRKRWDDIALDEQAEIVEPWLWTQHDFRSIVADGLTEHDFLKYLAKVMVERNDNRGWVL